MNSDQGELFPWQLARNTDPDTSHQAVIAALLTAKSKRVIVFTTLRAHPDGLTDFELADLTGLGDNARKRRSDLRNMGLVYDSGLRRPAPSGSSAIVWQAL